MRQKRDLRCNSIRTVMGVQQPCMDSLRLPLQLMNITSLVFRRGNLKGGSKTILASFMPLIHSYHRLHHSLSTIPLLILLRRACDFRSRIGEMLSLDEDRRSYKDLGLTSSSRFEESLP